MMPTSGIYNDASVNTFHVSTLASPVDWTTFTTYWETMMDSNRNDFPASVRQNDHILKVYNLASPEPRAPVWEATWDFAGAPTGEQLPHEVACCISYQGARVSGEDQKRRRGRMYLGPLDVAITEDGRPLQANREAMLDRLQTFIEQINLIDIHFIVWSRVNEAPVVVTNLWVDNAWDIQRRRGVDPTVRYSLAVDQL